MWVAAVATQCPNNYSPLPPVAVDAEVQLLSIPPHTEFRPRCGLWSLKSPCMDYQFHNWAPCNGFNGIGCTCKVILQVLSLKQ